MTDENSKEEPDGNALESMRRQLPKIIRFEDIARCGDEVWIENNGDLYRLQRTRNGKLIMTK